MGHGNGVRREQIDSDLASRTTVSKRAANARPNKGHSSMNVTTTIIVLVCLVSLVEAGSAMEAAEAPGIEKVEIQPSGAIRVNGKPFFPIMAWLQGPENFPTIKSCGMNTSLAPGQNPGAPER